MHFQHHSKSNVIDKDPDTRLEPVFLFGGKIAIRVIRFSIQLLLLLTDHSAKDF